MEYIVMKISGSLLEDPPKDFYARLRSEVLPLRGRFGIVIVAGGGRLARDRVKVLEGLGMPKGIRDLAGIEAARLNAFTLAAALHPYSPLEVPRTVYEVLEALGRGMIPVVGGFQPGQSTNAVSAVIADTIGARLIINLLHGVQGIYDRDPNSPGARMLSRVCYDEMEGIIARFSQEPGGYTLFDRVALEVVRRSGIDVVFADGRDPRVIGRIIEDPSSTGSMLTSC